jgi:phosphoglycolate phosphatase
MKLLLFDIDGTLLDSGGAGSRSLDLAFLDMFSIESAFKDIQMAGKTDMQIIREALSSHGLYSDNGIVPRMLESYCIHLANEIQNHQKSLKPGVTELLDVLNAMEGVSLGLLTGNIEAGARIKLGAFGLNDYFPAGAFGSDHEDRNMLLPLAVDRFRKLTWKDIQFGDCVIIGDTPRDVECARPYGAATVAVATGPYGLDQLASTGAGLVLPDLTGQKPFLEFISASS